MTAEMKRMKVVRVREKRNGEVVKDQEFTNDQFAKYISGDQVVYENDLMQTSTFFIVTEDITNLVRTTEMFKMGMKVGEKCEAWGSFRPSEEPYEFTSAPSEVPCGPLKRGAFERVVTFKCDEGVVLGPIKRKFTIAKKP